MAHFSVPRGSLALAIQICLAATASASAQAAEVEQSLTGVISGRGTVDFAGLFSPAGTDLNGKPVQIYFHYLTDHYKRSTSPNGSHNAIANAGLPGASTIVIVINGTRRVAVPAQTGAVYSATARDKDQLLLQSDFYTPSGTEVSVFYTSPVDFTGLGSNTPVLNNNDDYVGFTVNSSTQETLDFEVTSYGIPSPSRF